MTNVEKARQLFKDAKLAFPMIPGELAARLKEHDKWLFSTREIEISPYNLQHYICEIDEVHVEDYVVLSHSGHGVNSYALQYYIVHGSLEMFLHLEWGGVYKEAEKATADIRDCFSLTDEIVPATQTAGKLQVGDRLRIVGSDLNGSYWFVSGKLERKEDVDSKNPARVLSEALNWLKE